MNVSRILFSTTKANGCIERRRRGKKGVGYYLTTIPSQWAGSSGTVEDHFDSPGSAMEYFVREYGDPPNAIIMYDDYSTTIMCSTISDHLHCGLITGNSHGAIRVFDKPIADTLDEIVASVQPTEVASGQPTGAESNSNA